MEDSGDYDFSMSGLKTAVLRFVQRERAAGHDLDLPDLAASFQEAIVDVQVSKAMAAAKDVGAPTVLMGGGVVANSRLRTRLAEAGEREGIRVLARRCPCARTTRRWWRAWGPHDGRPGSARCSTSAPTRS